MAESEPQKIFSIIKVYVKDLSFESPRSPKIFTDESTFSPENKINIRWRSKKVGDVAYEVILEITIMASIEDEVVYLAEVQQAGLFRIENYSEKEMELLLGAYAPSTLLPFARQVLGDLIVKGGFPIVLVQPMDFDRLFQNNKEKPTDQSAESVKEASENSSE